MPTFGLKAGISVVDQGLISGAGFLLHILLARWLLINDYGVFAVVFSIFLFLSSFHNALILEPMSVLASEHTPEQLRDYITHSIWLHFFLSVVLSILLLFSGFGLMFLQNPMGEPLIGLAFAGPLILLFWLLRRACYLDGRAHLAIHGGFVYSLFLLVGILVIQRAEITTPLTAVLLLGISSMAASIILVWLLKIDVKILLFGCSRVVLTSLFSKHWKYGKWVVGSSFVHWAGTAGYVPLIGSLAGFSEAGALRAIQNLILPLQQILAGLANLWLPLNAKLLIEQGKKSLKANLHKMIIGTLTFSVFYLITIVSFSKPIITLLYGPGRYDQFEWLNWYLAAFAIIGVVGQSYSLALKALQRPDSVFYSQAGTAVITATVGSFLVWTLGLEGAAIGLNLSALIGTLILMNLCQWSLRKA
jgi:O-antigen/teichoic acid export membrane protein